MTETFEPGDVVQLKSGGPKMTVQRLIGEDYRLQEEDDKLKQLGFEYGDPVCEWFSGNQRKSEAFKASSLLKKSP